MTADQIQSNAEAFAAACRGERVEYFYLRGEKWADKGDGVCFYKETLYRVAPVPAARDWSKPDDVPGPVCWLSDPDGGENMITSISACGVKYTFMQCDSECVVVFKRWDELTKHKHSTDRKTWRKCVVEGAV